MAVYTIGSGRGRFWGRGLCSGIVESQDYCQLLVVGSPPECHCWCNNGYFLRDKGVGLGPFGVVSAVTLALTL